MFEGEIRLEETSSLAKPRPIRLLSAELIHRIAAGEIVDRPASALKELLENSVDAGSKNIRVLLLEAGLGLIEVSDDGCGLSREDLSVSVQRHATSKISTLGDLDNIHSLGFRGEALSAIASVSRLSIETFRQGSGSWMLEVVGGQKRELVPATLTRGTRVRVRDLFFNVPARLKFLKKSSGEIQECLDALEATALCHPDIAFEWSVVDAQGELRVQKKLSVENLESRFRNLSKITGDIIHAKKEHCTQGIESLEVFIFRPPATSPYQKHIRLNVNGRPVTDKRLPYALRDAFAGLIEVGQFPVALILFQADPSLIDVNIHPQKKEIRWPQGFSPAGLVYSIVREALASSHQNKSPASDSLANGEASQANFHSQIPLLETINPPATQLLQGTAFNFSPKPLAATLRPNFLSAPKVAEAKPPFSFTSLRIVGEVGAAWLVCESDQGLILVDQHAAHERVNFEKLLNKKDLIRSKPLLLPIDVEIPLSLQESVGIFAETLKELGFDIDDESLEQNRKLEIIAVPEADRKVDWNNLLQDIFYKTEVDGHSQSAVSALRVRIAASLACHGSIRRGQRLSNEQIKALFIEMDQIAWGGLCPHGRPVWISIAHEELEQLFHRT